MKKNGVAQFKIETYVEASSLEINCMKNAMEQKDRERLRYVGKKEVVGERRHLKLPFSEQSGTRYTVLPPANRIYSFFNYVEINFGQLIIARLRIKYPST